MCILILSGAIKYTLQTVMIEAVTFFLTWSFSVLDGSIDFQLRPYRHFNGNLGNLTVYKIHSCYLVISYKYVMQLNLEPIE